MNLIGNMANLFVDISDKQINNFNKENHVAVVGAHAFGKRDISVSDANGNDAILTTNHAYTVSRSDSRFVYLINPWDTSTEIPVDRETFKKFFNYIEEFDL